MQKMAVLGEMVFSGIGNGEEKTERMSLGIRIASPAFFRKRSGLAMTLEGFRLI